MSDAGVPMTQCLEILADQTENPTLSKAIIEIKTEVEGGGGLAEALAHHPKIFKKLYVNMIKAGETSGQLATIFNQLADLMEKQRDLRNKVKSGLFMPVMVLGFCLLVTIGLIVFVVPRFAEIFQEMNADLPAPTQVLINISRDVRGIKGLIALMSILVFAFTFKKVTSTDVGGRIWDQVKLKLPLFGSLITKRSVASFARTFGLLQDSGVPILESLEIVAETADNKIVSIAIREARDSIQQGESISKPLGESQVFPPMVTHMVVVGENTGTLGKMLSKIAELYEGEVDRAVEGLTKLIEPIMMIMVGGLVGTILICLYLPIFNLAGAMSGGV
jgi:type IV pilus assembly protein PilC